MAVSWHSRSLLTPYMASRAQLRRGANPKTQYQLQPQKAPLLFKALFVRNWSVPLGRVAMKFLLSWSRGICLVWKLPQASLRMAER
eukprot:4454499-Amphidinium_carterae.2